MTLAGIVFVGTVVRLLIDAIVGPKRSADVAGRMVDWSMDTLREQAEAAASAKRAMMRAEEVQELGKQMESIQNERKRLFKEQLGLKEKKAELEQGLASRKGDKSLSR